MILNDLDLGPSHPWPAPVGAQVPGAALIEGSRTIVWPRGTTLLRQDVLLWITAWQAIGGQAAMTLGAARYLVKQLEELAANPDLQPVYIQWTASAATGAFNRADERDGWYIIDNVQPNYRKFIISAIVECRMTVSQVAPPLPVSFAVWYSGAALSSSYTSPATALISFPVGSGNQPNTAASRTGGEGAIPISTSPVPNPLPFIRPSTIAGFFTGGCRVFDTINTGTNPVPVAGGTFINANWVEVKSTQHDFAGDCVVTNGLQLLLYQVGAVGTIVYLWNTSLGTPTWQQIGTVQFADSSGNGGTIRDYTLEKLGLQEVRVRLTGVSAGNQWVQLRQKTPAGSYHTYCEVTPLTQANTGQFALMWGTPSAYATGFTDSTSSTTFPSNLATTTVSGYAAAQGSAAGSPIFGFLYQNTPTTAQGRLHTTTIFALGDTGGPAVGTFIRYGFFVVPYSGTVVLATAQAIVAPLFQQWLFDKVARWVRG